MMGKMSKRGDCGLEGIHAFIVGALMTGKSPDRSGQHGIGDKLGVISMGSS